MLDDADRTVVIITAPRAEVEEEVEDEVLLGEDGEPIEVELDEDGEPIEAADGDSDDDA